MQRFFECGQVGRNDRHEHHREALYRFTVRVAADLEHRITPFFEDHPLITAKAVDFEKFAVVVSMMRQRRRHTDEGLAEIAAIAQTMNRRKPSRCLESSEAIRQPPRSDDRGEDMVLASWRHGEL